MPTLWQPYGNLMIGLGKSYAAKLRNGTKIGQTYAWQNQKQCYPYSRKDKTIDNIEIALRRHSLGDFFLHKLCLPMKVGDFFLILVQHIFFRIENNVYLCNQKDDSISNIELSWYE